MPEPPDFDQIAPWIEEAAREIDEGADTHVATIAEVIHRHAREALRQVWNARGAADAQAIEDKLATLTGWVTSEPYRQHMREAIVALDCGADVKCEACDAGYRLAADGIHYNDARGGWTWGVCRKIVAQDQASASAPIAKE
jgi:hypothetical protein